MTQHIRSRLAAKFVLLIAGFTALMFGLTAWYSYYSYRDAQLNHLQAKAKLLADFVASISPDRIFSYDFSSLHTYAQELSANRDVTYAIIVDAQGKPMTSFIDREDPIVQAAIAALKDSDLLAVASYIDRMPDTLSVRSPIRFNQQQIGTVRIGVTRAYIDHELHGILVRNVLGSLVIVALLSLGIYLIFLQNVLRPTQDLIDGARRVANGELRTPIPTHSIDELGQLATSFNIMMERLGQSNAERGQALDDLRELNHTLEIRVEERTRAIESANRELEQLALYDSLTGLPNRSLIQDRLGLLLRSANRTHRPFVVMLIDLDRFKDVNDTFGHHIGDELLKKVGRMLVGNLRDVDTVGRLGGDEFAILLPDTYLAEALNVADKILRTLDIPIALGGLSLATGASLGIAAFPEHGRDAGTLFKHADVAMYHAKHGKTGFCVYHPDIDRHSPERLAFIQDLRLAVESAQMELHYQPIVDIRTHAIHSVEALARWTHPVRGPVPPDQFIPIIEQTGLIRPFSLWVVETALQQWAAWNAAGQRVIMAVNLSMHNLQDEAFPAALSRLMQTWSVPPQAFTLEVTESAMMSDPEHVLKTLAHFDELGIAVAIDDFGTGYSSLSYLKRLSVTELKIDRGFVKDMCADKDDVVIVRSTIDLAHNLGLKVVAEGVEDAETLQLLLELQCDRAQGQYFGAPLPATEIQFASNPTHKQSLS